MTAVNGFRKQRPIAFWALLVILLAAAAGAGYRLTRPVPLQVAAKFTPPGPPADVDKPVPDALRVQFNYVRPGRKTNQPVPKGPPSVARIDLIGKTVTGIGLTPSFAGRWRWSDDRSLEFVPEKAWPAGTRFSVDFPAAIFSPETRLKRQDYAFETPAFKASIQSLKFYQDPTDSKVRRAVATLFFSHPVDEGTLKRHLSMTMRPSGKGIQTPPAAVGLTLTVDPHRRRAYVSSKALTLPPEPNTLRLTVEKGVAPATGGQPTTAALTGTVLIPDRYSYLKVGAATAHIVTNAQKEPEQVISLTFTDEIATDALLKKLSVYLLPEVNRRHNSRYWRSPREVTEQELAASRRLSLKPVPNPRPASTTYHFVIDVPEHRYLYLHIDPNLASVNGFVHASFYDTVMATPVYPREVRLTGEGSLLTPSGGQRLGIMARGLTALRISVGRLLPGQIAHLITQTGGDIRDPYFSNPRFTEKNIAAISRQVMDLKPMHPGKANYASIDLADYRPSEQVGYGLFFVSVKGWDKRRRRAVYGAADKRLILVTDLGLLVKNNADGSHEVFVQSIRSGRPVAGAHVRLLGRNGLPLLERSTDNKGHAAIPVTRDFTDEHQPTVYLVQTATDIAFIPFAGHSRQIDYSRYNVGGLQGRQGRKGELNAFVFSDRGIYRPGETVHLGMIVKKAPLDNVAGIPLEAAVRGPRGNTVKTEKIVLPEKGFFEMAYATEATADTGRYQVYVYLVRDNGYRGRMLGSADFSVEEFVPDTMKITSKLIEPPARGWTTAKSLTARVELQNLFGAPAQNRRVEARIRIRPARFIFKKFADYHFTDPFADSKRTPLHLDEALTPATTGADGRVRFDIPLDRFREGTYQLDFWVQGFDPAGGRSVSAANHAMISPLSQLVGFKSDGDLGFIHEDGKRHVDWIAIAPDLSLLALDHLTLRRLEIQHISTLVRQPDGTFKYQTVDRERELERRPFAIGKSGSRYALPTDSPGDYAVEIHGAGGMRLARLTYSVVGHGNLTGRLEKSAALQLKLDKSDYRPGETITMSITAPYVGAGLITIESDRVHAFKWFAGKTPSTMEQIELPENLEGNAYVNVSFVRDAASPEIFTSPLSTAVAPITIDHSRRRLAVGLQVPARVRPGAPLTIGYTTAKPSRVVIFAVDEGILQVAGYRTPKPLDHFLRKRALAVTTLQMLDLILPEFDLMRRIMASGGGAMQKALASNLNPFARETEKPAVFWSGIVDGGPKARTVTFTVPDTFAGNLKIMAVAVGEDAVGTATRSTLVRGPFVLSPAVLLQAAPGDEFSAAVGVANLVKDSGKKAGIEVSVAPSRNLEIIGKNSIHLAVDEGGEARAVFRVKAGASPGAASLTFSARLGRETMRRTAGLSIRPATAYRTTFISGYAKNGAARLDLTRRLFPQLARQRASASADPLVLVDALSAYLDHFPHGCTEQVVSQVFPLVGLLDYPGYAPDRNDIQRRFNVLIDRLQERQLADGGFSFWPGGRTAAGFPSVYVMHFLIESRERGLAVPTAMMRRGRDYLRGIAGRQVGDLAAAAVQAQAIYLLTRMGETTTNYLVHLQEVLDRKFAKKWKTDLAAVYMAATYRLLKMDADAGKLAGRYRLGKSATDSGGDFDRPLTRDAQVLLLLSRHFPKRARDLGGADILRFIDPIFKGRTNTIGASYSILALGAYGRLNPPVGNTEAVRFSLETTGGRTIALKGRRDPFPTAAYTQAARRISMDGSGPLFYLNVQSGFDRTPPTEALRQGLEIQRDFVDASGNVLSAFTQGQEVGVRLRIRSLKKPRVTNVAIVDLLPGGFEVVRRSVPRRVRGWQADYVDVREDRVIFYGSVGTAVRELTYRVKVTAPGTFTVPPTTAKSMYDRSLRAATAAGRLTVAPAP